mmetsp:Transcript_20041/g.57999  ORF Transcript_20041/g.57999 Transcript_20041/m.57999 type:complete len:363 (-) Transcript_20041:104-1192(-)
MSEGPGCLQTSDFERSLASYVDRSKPDPIVSRQLAALSVEWNSEDPPPPHCDTRSPLLNIFPDLGEGDAEGPNVKNISGVLTLLGEYISVNLHASCQWATARQVCSTTATDQPAICSGLHFQLKVSASIIPKTQLKRLQRREVKSTSKDENESADHEAVGRGGKSKAAAKKEQRAADKVRARMIDRLKNDRAIQHLLKPSRIKEKKPRTSESRLINKDEDDAGPAFLCEAFIYQVSKDGRNATEMEERVDASEDSMEGLRRSVFSAMEDNLSVMEMLLSLPFLPQSSDDGAEQRTPRSQGSALGHRAALRLLEDAMFDACEKEGEEEIMDDLRISEKSSDDSDSDCGVDVGTQKGPKKKRTG